MSQVQGYLGPSYSFVRNKVLDSEYPVIGYQAGIGIGINLRPNQSWEKSSVCVESLIIQKGYSQQLDKNYIFHFNYFVLRTLIQRDITEDFSLQAGIENAILISASSKYWNKTYNSYDVGLVMGANFLSSKRIGLSISGVYGLIPILNYYRIDAVGNFNGKIHDLKNTSFSLGLRFKMNQTKYYIK